MEIGQKLNMLYRTESIIVAKYLLTKANLKVRKLGGRDSGKSDRTVTP